MTAREGGVWPDADGAEGEERCEVVGCSQFVSLQSKGRGSKDHAHLLPLISCPRNTPGSPARRRCSELIEATRRAGGRMSA